MKKNQLGASYIGILFIIIAAALVAKILIAVWPAYWDDRMIDGQITELMQQSPNDLSPQKFVAQMGPRLEMNNIRDIKFQDVAQVLNTSGLQVKKKYEVRKPFLLNIDLVLKFEKDFDKNSVQAK